MQFHRKYVRRPVLVLVLVLAWGLTVHNEAQVFPEVQDAVFDSWRDTTGEHPADTLLRVGKSGVERATARVSFDLDNTVIFDNLECNFWDAITRAEVVLDVVSATDCPGNGCLLRVTLPSSNQPLAPPLHIANGTTGEVRFDVTADVRKRATGDLLATYRIEALTAQGEVNFRSLEGSPEGTGSPRLDVTNPPIPDTTVVARKSQQVFNAEISYLEAGDPGSANQFLLIHGVPSYSLMYRNVIPKLAEVGHVVAFDWVGLGRSSQLSTTDFDYRFDTQAAYAAELVRLLGMTDGGRELIVVIHEVGGLGGFHYATTHQDDVAGIAFYETWLDVCPDAFVGSATNPPPPAGQGLCQKDTLVPFPLFPLWENVIYPSEAGTCAAFTPLLVDPGTIQSFTFRPLSSALVAEYLDPYTLTPDCSQLGGLLHFPRNIPVPVAGEPAASRQLYDGYIAALKTWDVPKLLLVGDPGGGFNLSNPAQIDYAREQYPNLEAACIGRAGHFGPEDVPFNLGKVLLEWASAEGLLE